MKRFASVTFLFIYVSSCVNCCPFYSILIILVFCLFQVLLTSSEAVLSALPSPLLAEAQMLRDRAMSHYQARSLFAGSHRLNNRRNGLGFDRQTVMDRGVGVTIGRRTGSTIDSLKVKEIEGEPLLDANALKALVRLLRLAQVMPCSIQWFIWLNKRI